MSLAKIIVKLPPAQYDRLFAHVRATGTNISAFCRAAMNKAMDEAGTIEAPAIVPDQPVTEKESA